ncbi:MAG TPA: hypothetical protein VFB37_10960 [Steroidobacteraceae bacterium]|nr:hypothetical protein [Steroidobacteraceae bacterium]
MVRHCVLWIALAPLMSASAAPLEQSTAPATCDSAQHRQMDFWIGDWQVFDAQTRQLVGFDQVDKQYEGCVVRERLTFLTDMYRRPGISVRLAGIAINRFDGESWLQMWADNQWGAIVLRGRAIGGGKMEFVSIVPSRERDVKLVYEPQSDGTLRILQYVSPAGRGKWTQYGDLEYRRNR